MPESLTLQSKLFSTLQNKDEYGVTLPWEAKSYAEDFQTSKAQGGFFDLSHWETLEIKGPDSADFLHRMTTIGFRSPKVGHVQQGAILTGKAGVISVGFFETLTQEHFLFHLAPPQAPLTLNHLETFHFAENLELSLSTHWFLLAFFNASSLNWNREPISDLNPWSPNGNWTWVRVPRSDSQQILSYVADNKIPLLGHHLYEYYRTLSGKPKVGCDVNENNIILEANLDEVIDREKGCYPGQEVVERIYTYGKVNKKLFPVQCLAEAEKIQAYLPLELEVNEMPAAKLTSLVQEPTRPEYAVGLAYIGKKYWDQTEFTCKSYPDLCIRRL